MNANDRFIYQFRITGMDCPSCASKIEQAANKVKGIEAVRVSVSSQIMSVTVENETALAELLKKINELGYYLDSLNPPDGRKDLGTHRVTSAYKRALWIVITLNVGYGIIEMLGGFFSGSQALKADALDFFGDGLITLLGLLAIGWSLLWRARAAFAQGLFLGILGISVLGATSYRFFAVQQPEAELMGIYATFALCVNVAAALVLIPHRSGDSNIRAVWLFSRNDAIGNAAVLGAAGLVAWTKTPWPDLAVAVIIAAIFLHSAWTIIAHARADLRQFVKH